MPGFELENTSIWADVRKIIYSDSKPVKFEYRGQLHTPEQDFTVYKIISVDTVSDYANNVGDIINIKFKMGLGDYISRLFPFRTNLEFSIKRITLTEAADKKKPNTKQDVVRYKALFVAKLNPNTTGQDLEKIDTVSLNNVDMIDVTLQLVNRSLEPLRVKCFEGSIFRDVTPKQTIVSLMAGESMKVLVDGKPSIDGVNVVEPDNTEVRKHINIPSGTNLTSIPTFLHECMGGVYSGGIGTYLSYYKGKLLWFVYPLFNVERFDKTKDDKLIVFSIPQDRFQGLDRTYIVDGSIVKIVGAANKKYSDSADVDMMNKGSGFRMADARAYMKKPVEVTEDGPMASRTRLNHETVKEAREDGLNYAPMQRWQTSSNPFVQYTKVLGSNLARVEFVWENSNPDLLYPGMPCKYVYLDNGKPVQLKGTVVFCDTVTALQGGGISSTIYRSVTTVIMLVEPISTELKLAARKLPVSKAVGVF